ncbi:hypothetical protein NX059_005025 [Plenodomus lindquistii]|nr:hypothetical protein NX059_005025 [Plenodomus lindquistii]
MYEKYAHFIPFAAEAIVRIQEELGDVRGRYTQLSKEEEEEYEYVDALEQQEKEPTGPVASDDAAASKKIIDSSTSIIKPVKTGTLEEAEKSREISAPSAPVCGATTDLNVAAAAAAKLTAILIDTTKAVDVSSVSQSVALKTTTPLSPEKTTSIPAISLQDKLESLSRQINIETAKFRSIRAQQANLWHTTDFAVAAEYGVLASQLIAVETRHSELAQEYRKLEAEDERRRKLKREEQQRLQKLKEDISEVNREIKRKNYRLAAYQIDFAKQLESINALKGKMEHIEKETEELKIKRAGIKAQLDGEPPNPDSITIIAPPLSLTTPTAQTPDTTTANDKTQDPNDQNWDPTNLTPSIKTTTIQVDNTNLPPGVTLTQIPRHNHNLRHYTALSPSHFCVGDISWYPVLRLSNDPWPGDMTTKYGLVSAKLYPIIIVARLPDCMVGMLISTAGGNGMERKPESMRRRCAYVVSERGGLGFRGRGGETRKVIRTVDGGGVIGGGYEPCEGAFVDPLDTVLVAYDSRFRKVGEVVGESREVVVGMWKGCGDG